MREFLIEYWQFVKTYRNYWLIPLILVLMLVGGLVVFTQGSAIAPFVYTLF